RLRQLLVEPARIRPASILRGHQIKPRGRAPRFRRIPSGRHGQDRLPPQSGSLGAFISLQPYEAVKGGRTPPDGGTAVALSFRLPIPRPVERGTLVPAFQPLRPWNAERSFQRSKPLRRGTRNARFGHDLLRAFEPQLPHQAAPLLGLRLDVGL